MFGFTWGSSSSDGAHHGRDRVSRYAREIAEERAPMEAPGAEPLGDGEDNLAVRDGLLERTAVVTAIE